MPGALSFSAVRDAAADLFARNMRKRIFSRKAWMDVPRLASARICSVISSLREGENARCREIQGWP
jgi:hypothetical protein